MQVTVFHSSYYRALFDTKNSAESIFEVQFDNVNGNSLAFYNYPVTLGGRNEVGPRGLGSTLEAAYELGDLRKNASISPGGLGRKWPHYSCRGKYKVL